MSRLPSGAFRRYDETPDEEFYRMPRLEAVSQIPLELTPQMSKISVSCSQSRS
jgi:hypothetical protein